jgi:prepilin-type processing-associated H-X9-DG protein
VNNPPPDWFPFAKPHPGANIDPVTWDDINRTESFIRWRHMGNKQANFLFADGHAAPLRYSKNEIGGSELEWRNILPDNRQ